MTDTKSLKELSNLIGDFVEVLSRDSGIPTVKSCIVKSETGHETCIVSCNDTLHRVRSRGGHSEGDIVEVMLPNGNWNRAFIVY